ncbi:MAG: histidine phosphatase family protein [Alphaproteobacteria bacterium]|nr:histidine phosphatase family protein [Alphaproteobacteria bacterium]MBV9372896.1 histidine phosphatase family protein [Alphaproteobacteria bacterium]MBV9902084.1 histidine phosphatase family protein [Alphaproteobacteria bacterium]
MPARRLLAFAALALAACATTASPERSPPSVYVMRHLQKADGPDPGLSAEGAARAARLAAWLRADPPAAIYASTTRRARETAAPLAAALGLEPRLYDPGDTAGLLARVKAESGTVLVVGHSNTVPEIVAGLGAPRPKPLSEQAFGDIFRIGRDGSVAHLTLSGPPPRR